MLEMERNLADDGATESAVKMISRLVSSHFSWPVGCEGFGLEVG